MAIGLHCYDLFSSFLAINKHHSHYHSPWAKWFENLDLEKMGVQAKPQLHTGISKVNFFFFIYILNVFSNAKIGYLLLYSALSSTCCRYQQIYYSSPMIQKAMTLMVRTYPKKRLFVEFVWLNCVKVERPLRWSAAAKVNLLWPIKNVL